MFNLKRNTLYLLVKNEKKLILTGCIVGFLLFIFYYIFFYVPLYTTKCKIYAKNIAKSDLISSFGSGNSLVSESGHSNPLFNFYEILKSENMANKIYPVIKEKFPEDLSILGTYSEKDFSASYAQLINASAEPSTDIITFKLMWPNKRHAPIVLHEILEKFKEENLSINKTGESSKKRFIDKHAEEISEKLENIRTQIKNYKQTTNIANIDVETERLISQRTELEKQASLLKSQIQYNKSKLKEFGSELGLKTAETALRSTGIGTDPYLVNLNQSLAAADQKYASLRALFKDKYPEVIAIKNEIKTLNDLIDKRIQKTSENLDVPRAIYDNPSSQIVANFALTQAEMVSLQDQFKSLQTDINKFKKREMELPEIQRNLESLIKLQDVLTSAYQSVKEKQLEANIKENELIDNIVILNTPSIAYLSKIFIMTRFLGFILLGGLLGLAIAYIKQGIEDKWIDLEEIKEVTAQNIFTPIPWIKDFNDATTQNILDSAYTNIASELLKEAYLNKTSIITFISTGKCLTKSIIAGILVKKISQMGKNVLLTDSIKPENLNVLKNQYDFIFINAPHGFVILPEIQNLKRISEGIVVIAAMKTGRQDLRKFIGNISDSETKILGIISRAENSDLERNIKSLEQCKNLKEKDSQELINA